MRDPKSVLFWLSFLPSIVFFGYGIRVYLLALRNRPRIAKGDIIYKENSASGCSQKNFITKIGGANNCLRLVVTRELLWVTAWGPFLAFAAFYDLSHVIPLKSISSVETSRWFGRETLLLSYRDDIGKTHSLRLIPKDRERFLSAIQHRPILSEVKNEG